MPKPEDRKGNQRLPRLLHYVSNFIPNCITRTTCLKQLFHKGMEWVWILEHESEFNDLKCILTLAPVLQFFDSLKDTDASKDVLEAVIL